MELSTVVVRLASNGIPNALTICIMYGLRTTIKENSIKISKPRTRASGFSDHFRCNSLNLSLRVALG